MIAAVVLALSLIGVSDSAYQHERSSFFREKRATENTPDTCTSESYKLAAGQNPGNCSTFNNSPCMCDLTGNCHYDNFHKVCVKDQDCSVYDNQAQECRVHHCSFDCATSQCTVKKAVDTTCDSSCSEHCFDMCLCKMSGCQYELSTGLCTEISDNICSPTSFEPHECARANAVYSQGDTVCKNLAQQGDCLIDKIILAVNLGGPDFEDERGIHYTNGDSVKVKDEFGILQKYATRGRIRNIRHTDEPLYRTTITLDPSKRGPNKCVSYNMTICEEGRFELAMKLVELHRVYQGERTINIKLGDLTVFPEFDVVAFATDKFLAIELVVNFEVLNNVLIVDDSDPVPLDKGQLELSFCYGECIFTEAAPSISAFSVVKLAESSRQMQTAEACSQYKDSRWECVQAKCQFNQVTGECTKYYRENTCEKKCPGPSLELVFLVDGTSNKTLTEFTRIVDVVDNLKERFDSAKFGIATFADFKCRDWFAEYQCKGDSAPHHNDRFGCYKRLEKLTTDAARIKQNSKLEYLKDVDNHVPVYRALMMAAADVGFGWSAGASTAANKIIVLVTGSRNHFYNPYYLTLATPNGDGKDTCEKHGQPSTDLIKQVMEREGVSVYLMAVTEYEKNHHLADINILRNGKYKFDVKFGKITDDVSYTADEIFSLAKIKPMQQACGCT